MPRSERTTLSAVLLGVLSALLMTLGIAFTASAQVINEPPAGGVSIVVFPSRDFVSTSGWLATDLVTIEVIRDGRLVTSSPAVAPAGGVVDINHVGNACWTAVTPDLRVGDIVRGTSRNSAGAITGIHQTHVSGAVNRRAELVQSDNPATPQGEGIIRVRGTAYNANGQPIPLDQLEQRIIATAPSRYRFVINGGKRTLRASISHPDLEGVISYDVANNPLGGNWTATYSNLVDEDVKLVMGGLSLTTGVVYTPATACAMWLGIDPLTVAESTISENDDVNLPGPAAGACASALEAIDVTPPSKVLLLNMTRSATGAVTLTWGAATDDWSVAYYQITRDGQPIANLLPTTLSFVDATPPPGIHTYGMVVYDHASPLGAGATPAERIAAGFGLVYGNVSAIDTLSTTRDYVPPTAPTQLAMVSKPGQAELSWTAATDNLGVASYRIYRNGVAVGDVAAPATAFIDVVPVSGNFTYTVDAADFGANRSPLSLGVSGLVRIPADIIPPGAPTLAAPVVTSTSFIGAVTLHWTPAADNVAETGYGIYLDGVLVDSVLVPTTTWSKTGVAFGTYTYEVDAYDAPFNHGAKSAPQIAVVAPPVPGTPTGVAHTATLTSTGANMRLNWTPAVDLVNETGYGIYLDGVLVDSVLAPATSYSRVVGIGTFVFQVDSYVAGVNRGPRSAPDTLIVLQPVPAAPTAISHTTASTATGADITLNWTPAVDLAAETGYGIYRDGVLVDSVLAPATSYNTALAFGRYAFRVDAYIEGINRGPLSAVDSVIVSVPVPGAPTALTHTTTSLTASGGSVRLSWTPALDNVAETGYGIYRDGVLVDSVLAPNTSYTTNLALGTYAFTVDAYVSGLSRSAQSAVRSVIVSVQVPGAPTGLTHTATISNTGGAVRLSWTPAVDNVAETGYGIYRDGVLVDSVLAPATSYNTNLAFGSYAFTVDAYVSGLSRSAQSAVRNVVVSVPVPGAPTGLTHTATISNTGGAVRLSWTPAVDNVAETGYGIYRDGVLVDSVLAPTTSYNTNLAFGSYVFTVDAYVSGLSRSAQSTVRNVVLSVPVPGAPTALVHTTTLNATGGDVRLSWTPAVDNVAESGYGIYRDGVLVDSVLAPTTSYTTALAFGTYAFTVDAYVSGLSRSAQSAVRSVIVRQPLFVAAPGVPSSAAVNGNMAVAGGNNIVNSTLPFLSNWTASATAGLTSYHLQVSVNSAAWTNVALSGPLATSLSNALAVGGTTATTRRTYQYRVRAVAGPDSSAWSIGTRFGVTALDNGSASIVYAGTWATNNVNGAYGGSVRSGTVSTATATHTTAVLTSPGSIALVMSKGTARGRVLVSLDGAPAVTIDTYATTTQNGVVVYSAPLAAGVAHTLRVTPAGTRNAASSSNRVDLDAIMVVTAQAGATPAAAQLADDTDIAPPPAIEQLSFAPVSPNPSRGLAMLKFALPRDGDVEVGIVDVQGRQVSSLHRGSLAAGPHTLTWDGRSSSGQPSAPGVYFAVVRFANEMRTQRIIRVP